MSSNINELLSLLEQCATSQSFVVKSITNKQNLNFKKINLLHLKEILSAIADSSLTLTKFNNVSSKMLADCLLEQNIKPEELNVIDRLLFVLHSRVHSVSNDLKYVIESDDENQNIERSLKLDELIQNLERDINKNISLFEDKTIVNEDLLVKYGIPTIATDLKANEQAYLNEEIEIGESLEENKNILAKILMIEITKSIKQISIKDILIDFNNLSFEERILLAEKLPLNVVNEIMRYLQDYKTVLEDGLTNKQDGFQIKVDSSLFVI